MIRSYSLLVLLLLVGAFAMKAQQGEYNRGNNWVHATAQKRMALDFTNTATGVLRNNGTIRYSGNFQNDGIVGYDNTLAVGSGLSSFTGASAQTLSGSGTTSFYNLQFSGVSFSLQQPITVINQLDLNTGIVTAQQTTLQTAMNQVLLPAGSSCINASSASFVDGFVQKTGNTAFTFPIGNSSYYRPLSIAAPVLDSETFSARYIYADPTAGGYDRAAKASGVGEVSNKEYWLLQRTAGSSYPQVTLGWNRTTSAPIPTDLTQVQVVRWDGSQWINEGNISTTGDVNAGSITANVTGFGVMSLAVQGVLTKQLVIKAYLQQLWNDASQKMNQCMTDDGVTPEFVSSSDAVSIELHDPSAYSSIVYTASGLLIDPDGTIHSVGSSAINIPTSYSGSYYITVKGRNHLETTSASPVSLAASSVNYDFTTAASKAYGSNQVKLKDGVYGIYSGDVDHDGIVDNLDMTQMDMKVQAFALGYQSEDLNGDGFVDNLDVSSLNNAVASFIYAILPQ